MLILLGLWRGVSAAGHMESGKVGTELGSRYTVWISFRKGGIWHFVDRLAVVKESPVGAD